MRIFRNEKLVDREKEIEFLKDWFGGVPKEILWIYGPKSSGKTTLIEYVIEKELIKDFKLFDKNRYWIKYLNLRGLVIGSYNSFIEAFFEEKDEEEQLDELNRRYKLGVFELEAKTLKKIRERKKNLFNLLIEQLNKINKQKIIIIDEIQTLEDIYINGEKELLKEFLNFCVRLTKELHLSHLVILSSNTIFINRIYNYAKLKKTSTFYKIDHIERIIVEDWLKKENFTNREIGLIWEYLGGCVFDIQRLLRNRKNIKSLQEYLEHQKWLAYTEIMHFLNFSGKVTDEERRLFKEIAKIILKRGYFVSDSDKYRTTIEKFSDIEILFFDPLSLRVTGNNRLYEKGMEIFLGSF